MKDVAISITLWVFHRILVWSANLTTLYLFSSLEKVAPSIAAAGKNKEVARDKMSGGSHKSEVPLQQLCHDAICPHTVLNIFFTTLRISNFQTCTAGPTVQFSFFFLSFSFSDFHLRVWEGSRSVYGMYGKRTLRWLFSQYFKWLKSCY